mgnify:FL=1
MIAVQIGRNPSTSLYEVHKSGCRHLRRLENPSPAVAGESAQAVADTFEAENDGCLATLGPCV